MGKYCRSNGLRTMTVLQNIPILISTEDHIEARPRDQVTSGSFFSDMMYWMRTMHITITLKVLVRCGQIGESYASTYNIPVENTAPRAIFCRNGNWSLYSICIGRTMIIKSVMMFRIACHKPHL